MSIRFRNKNNHYFKYYNPILGKKIEYAEIEVPNQVLNVKGIPIKNTNVYDVEADEINNPNYYHDPFKDPDYNSRNIFKKYNEYMRKKKTEKRNQFTGMRSHQL